MKSLIYHLVLCHMQIFAWITLSQFEESLSILEIYIMVK